VAVARAPEAARDGLTHIAACVDAEDDATHVLRTAQRLAEAHGATLSAVHVVHDSRFFKPHRGEPDTEQWRGEWERKLTEIVGATPCEPVLLDGEPAGRVVGEWAERENIDLLVAASHREVAHRFFLGSFASYVVHHAPTSVLIAR
jgi:nucleotide-binding universal stress UspA family protein